MPPWLMQYQGALGTSQVLVSLACLLLAVSHCQERWGLVECLSAQTLL